MTINNEENDAEVTILSETLLENNNRDGKIKEDENEKRKDEKYFKNCRYFLTAAVASGFLVFVS